MGNREISRFPIPAASEIGDSLPVSRPNEGPGAAAAPELELGISVPGERQVRSDLTLPVSIMQWCQWVFGEVGGGEPRAETDIAHAGTSQHCTQANNFSAAATLHGQVASSESAG